MRIYSDTRVKARERERERERERVNARNESEGEREKRNDKLVPRVYRVEAINSGTRAKALEVREYGREEMKEGGRRKRGSARE